MNTECEHDWVIVHGSHLREGHKICTLCAAKKFLKAPRTHTRCKPYSDFLGAKHGLMEDPTSQLKMEKKQVTFEDYPGL